MKNFLLRISRCSGTEEGVVHWWAQRLTSVVLVPLALWFGFSLAVMPDLSQLSVTQWLSHPVNAVLLFIFVVTSGYHLALGLRVIVEDYVHGDRIKAVAILGMEAGAVVLVLLGAAAILDIAL